MWYVVQVYGGREESTAGLMKQWVSRQFLTDCFIPVRERERKFHGKWNFVREVLFPGYIFVESSAPGKLFGELKRVPRLTRLLGGDGGEEICFIPLEEKEARGILGLGDDNHVTGISKIRLAPEPGKESGKDGRMGMAGEKRAEENENKEGGGCGRRCGGELEKEAGKENKKAERDKTGGLWGAEETRRAGRRIEVVSGPLKGKEGRIVRVNLHRREAVVRIDFMGREMEIFLGIEMVGEER